MPFLAFSRNGLVHVFFAMSSTLTIRFFFASSPWWVRTCTYCKRDPLRRWTPGLIRSYAASSTRPSSPMRITSLKPTQARSVEPRLVLGWCWLDFSLILNSSLSLAELLFLQSVSLDQIKDLTKIWFLGNFLKSFLSLDSFSVIGLIFSYQGRAESEAYPDKHVKFIKRTDQYSFGQFLPSFT